MEEVTKYGRMVASTKDISKTIKQMVVEDLSIKMEKFMMGFGKIINHTDLVSIP